MAKKTKRPRNYDATDLTRVNLHALKKRLELLAMDLDALGARVANLETAQPAPAPEPSLTPAHEPEPTGLTGTNL